MSDGDCGGEQLPGQEGFIKGFCTLQHGHREEDSSKFPPGQILHHLSVLTLTVVV